MPVRRGLHMSSLPLAIESTSSFGKSSTLTYLSKERQTCSHSYDDQEFYAN